MTRLLNRDRPTLTISFFGLERFDPEHPGSHKSVCPSCTDGILLMGRDNKTGKLLAEDNCMSCGQRFVYADIERVRRELR